MDRAFWLIQAAVREQEPLAAVRAEVHAEIKDGGKGMSERQRELTSWQQSDVVPPLLGVLCGIACIGLCRRMRFFSTAPRWLPIVPTIPSYMYGYQVPYHARETEYLIEMMREDRKFARRLRATFEANCNDPANSAILEELESGIDIELAGFFIPRDTTVFINLWAIHHDPDRWEDPFCFRPERFLDEHSRLRLEGIMSFSSGKRSCPGESFARKAVFLYAARLLYRFKFESPPGAILPDEDGNDYGILLDCKPFEVCAVPRRNHGNQSINNNKNSMAGGQPVTDGWIHVPPLDIQVAM